VPFVLIFLKINGKNLFCLLAIVSIFVSDNRAAAMTIRTVLLSLQALLATPEPDDPQDAGNINILPIRFLLYFMSLVVANQYKKDRKLFEKTARHWANVYANGK
jgi:ubiquitin-conjugating enzyme (huntingtin interacting protein 2)